MVMTYGDIACKTLSRGHISGLDRGTACDKAVNDLGEQAADDHVISAFVKAGHERVHLPDRGHAAQTIAALDQQHFCAGACCGDRCADTGWTAADYGDLGSIGIRDTAVQLITFHRQLLYYTLARSTRYEGTMTSWFFISGSERRRSMSPAASSPMRSFCILTAVSGGVTYPHIALSS